MCSFLGTSKEIPNLTKVNFFQRFRGPDLTNVVKHKGVTLVHNLLSITGDTTPQPFIESGIATVFNGEIYNYKDFGTYKSDGEVLIPLYKKYGSRFAEHLDGEFAVLIVDSERETIVVSTDVFGTKPLWVAFEQGGFGVATYKSALDRLDFKNIERLPPNTTRVYESKNGTIVEDRQVYTFSLAQHKNTYDDFITAFEQSIKKRSHGVTKKIFMGLSSGYDSGVIACELEKQHVDFKIFCIEGNENTKIIDARMKLHQSTERFVLSFDAFLRAKEYLKQFAEDVYMNIVPKMGRGGYVSDNTGAIGLSEICRRAQVGGYRVFFSGQGADEIFSDYGFDGKKYTKHSSFGGKFPVDLNTVFPWENFWNGTQRAYLDKEETVAGSHGIETRYPFLDKDLVQEFLWLSADLKNRYYKAPLHTYLTKHEYPFDEGEKIGFTPDKYTNTEKLTILHVWLRTKWAVYAFIRKYF